MACVSDELELVYLKGRNDTVPFDSSAQHTSLPWRDCSCLIKGVSLEQTTYKLKRGAPCGLRQDGKAALLVDHT